MEIPVNISQCREPEVGDSGCSKGLFYFIFNSHGRPDSSVDRTSDWQVRESASFIELPVASGALVLNRDSFY